MPIELAGKEIILLSRSTDVWLADVPMHAIAMLTAAWLPAHSSHALTAEGDAKATTCAALAVAKSPAGRDWTGTVLYVLSLSTAKPLAERPACKAHKRIMQVHAGAAGHL